MAIIRKNISPSDSKYDDDDTVAPAADKQTGEGKDGTKAGYDIFVVLRSLGLPIDE